MTFHVLSLPHTVTSKKFLPCAYTQKVLNLCKILNNLGLSYYHYGNLGAEVNNHVTTIPAELYDRVYGKYDWKSGMFQFDQHDEVYTTYYANTSHEIKDRWGKLNFVLCPWGWGSKPVVDLLPKEAIAIESGIGYEEPFAYFKVFESYAWMHYVYGLHHTENAAWYDAVIPNYYDLSDFYFQPDKKDYVLFIGRLIPRKGIDILCEIARRFPNTEFVCAGQGSLQQFNAPSNMHHVGCVDLQRRKDLLSNAKVLIAPTVYHEPFGGVIIEAMLSGTPVITTDVGGFTEYNVPGYTGFRFRCLNEAVAAINNIGSILPSNCRSYAVKNFSLQRAAGMYLAYFNQILNLYGPNLGWYDEHGGDLTRFN